MDAVRVVSRPFSAPAKCGSCDKTIRPTRRPATFRFGSERLPVHRTCLHRLAAGDGCGCDICTGDIH